MENKAFTPDKGNRPNNDDYKKGYAGHTPLSPPPQQQPQTPSQPNSGSNPSPTNSDKK